MKKWHYRGRWASVWRCYVASCPPSVPSNLTCFWCPPGLMVTPATRLVVRWVYARRTSRGLQACSPSSLMRSARVVWCLCLRGGMTCMNERKGWRAVWRRTRVDWWRCCRMPASTTSGSY